MLTALNTKICRLCLNWAVCHFPFFVPLLDFVYSSVHFCILYVPNIAVMEQFSIECTCKTKTKVITLGFMHTAYDELEFKFEANT